MAKRHELEYNPQFISEVIDSLCISQTYLAKLLGVTQPAISQYMRQGRQGHAPTLERIMIMYNICAQNGVKTFPLFMRDGKPVDVAIPMNYRGRYTLAERLDVSERKPSHIE